MLMGTRLALEYKSGRMGTFKLDSGRKGKPTGRAGS